jgi:hypothetical protein
VSIDDKAIPLVAELLKARDDIRDVLDELGALRRLRDMALALTPYADDVQVESHFPDLADRLRSLTEVARSAGAE